MRLLVVDDDALLRRSLNLQLAGAGYQVRFVNPAWLKGPAWALTAAIILLNGYLLVLTVLN
jgi:CheY-like chemotaxis protein